MNHSSPMESMIVLIKLILLELVVEKEVSSIEGLVLYSLTAFQSFWFSVFQKTLIHIRL